jgi:hypothetical protein
VKQKRFLDVFLILLLFFRNRRCELRSSRFSMKKNSHQTSPAEQGHSSDEGKMLRKNRTHENHYKPYEGETKGFLDQSSNLLFFNQHQHQSHVQTEISTICLLGSHISSRILDICTSANHQSIVLNKEERSRFQFLKDTINLILHYISLQNDENKECESFLLFLQAIIARMSELNKMAEKIYNFQCALTPNFDIFELTLRNYYQEMRTLFPLDKSPKNFPPSSLIEDSKAREAWESVFGSSLYFVSFSDFLQMLITQQIIDPNARNFELFQMYLRYFINFPANDLITPYKWNWLVRLFGPCDSFFLNFTRIATGTGFLGLTNRIQAYEILTLSHQPRCYLIRMSRTEPQFLAFSYRNSSGHIGHQINKDPTTGLPIPIDQFVQSKFANFTLVSKSLDVDRILNASTFSEPLLEYASFPSGYVI